MYLGFCERLLKEKWIESRCSCSIDGLRISAWGSFDNTGLQWTTLKKINLNRSINSVQGKLIYSHNFFTMNMFRDCFCSLYLQTVFIINQWMLLSWKMWNSTRNPLHSRDTHRFVVQVYGRPWKMANSCDSGRRCPSFTLDRIFGVFLRQKETSVPDDLKKMGCPSDSIKLQNLLKKRKKKNNHRNLGAWIARRRIEGCIWTPRWLEIAGNW